MEIICSLDERRLIGHRPSTLNTGPGCFAEVADMLSAFLCRIDVEEQIA